MATSRNQLLCKGYSRSESPLCLHLTVVRWILTCAISSQLGTSSLLKQLHLDQRCTQPIVARHKHTASSGNHVQEDAASQSDIIAPSSTRSRLDLTGSSGSAGFPLLSASTHYTQLFRNPINLPSVLFRRSIITNHNFNTNRIVSKLEKNGFQRSQAEGIMRGIKSLLGQQYVTQ